MTAKFSKLPSMDQEEEEVQPSDSEGQVHLVLEEVHIRGNRGCPSRLCTKIRKMCRLNSVKAVIIALAIFCAAIVISLILSELVREPTPSTTETYSQGAVATDVPWCSDMAAKVLEKNGSAVDAAITALLCVGAVSAESSGIGGGGFMVVYDTNGSVYSINFRETAPLAATVDMYHSNASLSKMGGLSVAVPGEIQGMEVAHGLFGRLQWSELFEPVVQMCREGFNMTNHTEAALSKWSEYLGSSELFKQMYFTTNGELKKAGDIIQRPEFADTLEAIAQEGARAFYNGTIAQSIVDEVQGDGGNITLEDLARYQAVLEDTVHIDYNGYTIHSSPVPSGGPELLFSLNVLDNYDLRPNDGLTYHRIVEAFKYAFALRSGLGDPKCDQCGTIRESVLGIQENMTSESYAARVWRKISDNQTYDVPHYHPYYDTPPDHGTTHISVIAPDGQAVSVTSTINTWFGSKLITKTGIILNNEMDDFSSPNITNFFGVEPSEVNYIHPGKRPLSSTCPAIVVKTDTEGTPQAHLVIGAAGGTRIPTATAQATLQVLSLGESLSNAIEAQRLHHQLMPNHVSVEENFPGSIVQFLQTRGHEVVADDDFAVVQGVMVGDSGSVTAHSDSRKAGRATVISILSSSV